ncbi:MAG: transposase [Pseudomonadota bacterium]|nr:transposase [Pseudomonadota bacterium]
MLSIVFCEDKPASPPGRDLAEVLARTLASLVTAKIEGLLGDVRIAGPAGKGLGVLANHAGCALVEAANEAEWLRLALEAARGPDIFLLRCGRAPEAGFIEEAGDSLAGNIRDQPRAACLRAVPESFFERIFPSLAPVAGLIASRDRMLGAPRGGFAKLAGCIGPAATFHARARRIR